MSTFTKGIDVSLWNGVVDWEKMKTQGYDFSYVKATEGEKIIDKQFSRNWTSAKSAGLSPGAYHFFHPKQDIGNQVNNFVSTLGKLRLGDLPPMLDIETTDDHSIESGGVVDWSRADIPGIRAAVQKWLIDVEKVVGIKPIYYMNLDWFRNLGGFDGYGLFIAQWQADHPNVPEWLFWQTDDSGGLDTDLFNGTYEQLADISFKG